MAKYENPLNNLKIASPCSQDWDAMMGDNRKRYCSECKLNVYNLSGMTKTEAENLITNAEGRLCIRFYQRPDGTVLTQDCPVGWAKLKQRAKIFATAAFSLIMSLFSGLLIVSAFKNSETRKRKNITMGAVAVENNSNKHVEPSPIPVMGNVAPIPKTTPRPREVMGEIAIPNDYQMGKMAVKDRRN